MGEPSDELLPWRSELVPRLFREIDALLLVVVEDIVELARGVRVDDDGVFLVIPAEAAGVEVGAADGAEAAVDHDDFGVVEARLVQPYVHAALHQLVYIIEYAVRSQRNVALCRYHYLNLHAALDRVAQRFLQLAVEGQIRIDELDGVLGAVDGVLVERPDDLVRRARLAVDDAHHLAAGCLRGVRCKAVEALRRVCAEIFRPPEVLAGDLLPYPREYHLELVDGSSLYAAVHVAPFSHLFRAVDIIVGHVHSARVGYASVDDDNLAVVAEEDVVDPWEAYRVELVDVDTGPSEAVDVLTAQRLVVRVVAETVEQGSHFHALGRLHTQKVEQLGRNGVVAEVEVFEVNAAAGLPDGFEHVVKLGLSGGEQRHAVVVTEGYAVILKYLHDGRIASVYCKIACLRLHVGRG